MEALSKDLRRRIVDHYLADPETTYADTAKHFSVGEATVSRLLNLKRATGDVEPIVKPRRRRFKVDLTWLEAHANKNPDARLKDRAFDYERDRGVRVSVAAMWYAMQALGWTHKKRRFSPGKGNRNGSNDYARIS